MTLVLGSIVPHPPLLIPTIGKSNRDLLKTTILSYQKISDKLKEKRTDTIIIISPHSMSRPDIFLINLGPDFTADFKEFGDFSSTKNWAADIGLAYRLREGLESSTPLQLSGYGTLDHGSSVPLTVLCEKLPDIKIVPISSCFLSPRDHFEFGKKLRAKIEIDRKNIAVIASGDLSHRLKKNAPAGYSPKGKKFDKKLMELLSKSKIEEIINMDEDLLSEAGECGLRSILILLGILDKINYQPKLLSYDDAFGVGYLSMDFSF